MGEVRGLICAGGEATRLGELTRVANKHLLPIGRWPMIYYPLQLLQLAGVREVLVVTGKGGVGKTTIAAGLASAFAVAGRRTLVLEVDPRENAHRMLGLPPSGGQVTEAAPRLWLQNLRPRDVLDGIVREQVRVGPIARRVLESEVYRHFAEGAPGLSFLGHGMAVNNHGGGDGFSWDTEKDRSDVTRGGGNGGHP